MNQLNKVVIPDKEFNVELPEKAIQFGEGNFIRGFIDWMIHQMNKKSLFNGKVIAVQPTPHGKVIPKINTQDGLYTVVLRGIQQGKAIDSTEVITSIQRGINPYEEWEKILEVAENPELEFVFSNTTEAGIVYKKENYNPTTSPLSFPGKLTSFLYHRFKKYNGDENMGLFIFPCELIENNGNELKEIVLQICDDWNLPNRFKNWVTKNNYFFNTLVDRIVTGYPKENDQEFMNRLGYQDQLVTIGEPYHLLVIEGENYAIKKAAEVIPFHEAGLNVHWTKVEPFRNLKVRILNGAHTMLFAISYMSGNRTVLETMEDDEISRLIHDGIWNEILPVIDEDEVKKNDFAKAVIERFKNPYNKHYLTDLGLNAIYKWKTRLLPTLNDWIVKKERLPSNISFSLAALILYYRPERLQGDNVIVRDEKEVVEFFMQLWNAFDEGEISSDKLIRTVLSNEGLWDTDLNRVKDLAEKVCTDLNVMLNSGMEDAVRIRLQA